MTFDPRKHGAKCDVCPLQGCTPVPPESPPQARFALVGEAPGEDETRTGRPFVGASGKLLTSSLRAVGILRGEVHWTNAILCQPPNNDLKRLLESIKRDNKAGASPPIPTPQECCAPRLANELRTFRNILAVGGTGLRAVTGQPNSVMELRGAPLDLVLNGVERRVMAVLHPAFVLRSQRWKHIFISDLARARRYFDGALTWDPPKITYHPSPEDLAAFLARGHPYYSCDLETDGIECLTAKVRCVGIGYGDEVYIVGLRTIAGDEDFYFGKERTQIIDILRDFFTNESIVKMGHNFGYYDRIVIEQQFGVTPRPILDTILLHRLVESELPHSLGFLGSTRTDAPSWKTDREGRKKSTQSETDFELHEYCGFDVRVTDQVLDRLITQVHERKQDHLIATDHRVQEICADMHTVGMYVDQNVRRQEHDKLRKRLDLHLAQVRDAIGVPDFNPGSVYQLRRVLFDEWGLNPDLDDKTRFTPAGDPSTSDDVLRACLLIGGLSPHQRVALEHTRYYRKAQKLIGTYVAKINYDTEVIWEGVEDDWDTDDPMRQEDWDEYVRRVQYGEIRRGIVNPNTGRMHPGYNAHVTTSGRLSSSKPINSQNFPSHLRRIITAAPGHILIGADADQLELRAAAARWRSKLYIDVLNAGYDPHSTATCMAVFGADFERVAGSKAPWDSGFKFNKEAKLMRVLGKRVQYASQYGAEPETVCRVIRQTELPDPDALPGEEWRTILPYARMTLQKTRLLHTNWKAGARFDVGWAEELATWQKQGYLTEPVAGRRRDFLDGENINEIYNFPIQAGGASLMNLAIIEVADQIKLHQWGPGTGIINQCHDSIVVECPLDGAYKNERGAWVAPPGSIPWRVKHIIEAAMNRTHPGFPGVSFTATAELGMSWDAV